MTIVNDCMDEQTQLANAKAPWERYHRNVAAWVLPQTEHFDTLVNTGGGAAGVMAVTGQPVAAERSKHIYDMTSLWAIDRLTAGLVSLKTPESDSWHDLNIDDDFGYVPNFEEKVALENVRDYLFRMRGNPKTGFWSAHKATVKSMCAFGDGWMHIKEKQGSRVPFIYEHMPLPELFPAVGPDGQPNRMYRVFSWTAAQIAAEWPETCGEKVKSMANDPKRRHERLQVMHCVRPRSDGMRGFGIKGAEFASYYILPGEKHLIGEGGYWEFPFTRYAWSNIGQRAFCEGPVALAIAEIQSLQAMSRDELIASQMLLRPPIATAGKNFTRLNFNAGAVNPGLINGDGNPLFAPLNAGVRPDFAQSIIESRRNNVREMLYLNLWQILVSEQNSPQETATRSMLRAQEKGEMLGPVGISLNEGLSHNVDREIGIIARKGAFRPGSRLELPESLQGAGVSPVFTSPLDRLRRMGQITGVQQVLGMLPALEPLQPGISARIDADEILEMVQDVSGAPAKMLRDRKASADAGAANAQQAQAATALGAAQAAGDAAQSLGAGAQQAAAGAEAAQSPGIQQLLAAMQPQAAA